MNTAPNQDPQAPVPEPAPAASTTPVGIKVGREIYEWIEIFTLTISVILLVFTFGVRVAYVDGDSMNKTLYDKETLAVTNLFYEPRQGDIVVFQSPVYSDGGLVKRVIATEGQTVDIDFETWTVTVDGITLSEPYVNRVSAPMVSSDVEFPLVVPEGHVFVMGDNRNNSTDSRCKIIGCVDERFIFGHVLFRITPFEKFGAVD